MQSASAATAKYQLSLPFALASVSPGLAALHACRTRAAYPADTTLKTSHCSHCGLLFRAAGGSIRLVRLREHRAGSSRAGDSNPLRVLRRTCEACGHVEDVPVERGNASLFPMPRKRAHHAKVSSVNVPDRPRTASTPSNQLKPSVSTNMPDYSRLGSASSTPLPAAAALQPRPIHPPTDFTPRSRSSTPVPNADPARLKSRPKKKASLQDMLARNRQKQDQEKTDSHGLSAFLQGLT